MQRAEKRKSESRGNEKANLAGTILLHEKQGQHGKEVSQATIFSLFNPIPENQRRRDATFHGPKPPASVAESLGGGPANVVGKSLSGRTSIWP